ncbi:MAG: hypothetical protein ACREDR_33655, partial [Blastocatellia bacterium]
VRAVPCARSVYLGGQVFGSDDHFLARKRVIETIEPATCPGSASRPFDGVQETILLSSSSRPLPLRLAAGT